MRVDTAGVLQLGVAGDFDVSGSSRVRFGGVDECPPDIPAAYGRLDVPALDKRRGRRRAAGCLLAIVQLQKPDEAAVHLRHEHDR